MLPRPIASDGQSPRHTWAHLSPNQQLGYGCLVIAVISALVMYCAGTTSILVRSSFVPRAFTPTPITPPIFGVMPTLPPPTIIPLPPGTLLATPTQVPIPTREPPTATPTPTPTLEAFATAPITSTLAAPTNVTRGTPPVTRTLTRPFTSTATPRR